MTKFGDYLLTDGVAIICRIIERGLNHFLSVFWSLPYPFHKPFKRIDPQPHQGSKRFWLLPL